MNLLRIGPLKNVFATMYSVEQAQRQIKQIYPLIVKTVQIGEDFNAIDEDNETETSKSSIYVVESVKSAIDVIKTRVKMLMDNGLFMAKGSDGKTIEVLLDADKNSSTTKVCIRLLNTLNPKNSVWNVFPLVSYFAKDNRKHLEPIAGRFFAETSQKSIEIDNITYELKWKLGGDLFFICEMLGLHNSRTHPCPKCKIQVKRTEKLLCYFPQGQSHPKRTMNNLKQDGQHAIDKQLSHFEGVKGRYLKLNTLLKQIFIGQPLIELDENLDDLILAPLHVFVGIVTELVKLLFEICKNSQSNLLKRMDKLGINYKFKPENLSGRQGLSLIKRCGELFDCLHSGTYIK